MGPKNERAVAYRAAQQPELCGHTWGAPGNLVHIDSQREWPWPEYPRLGRGFLQGPGVSNKPEAQAGIAEGRRFDSTHVLTHREASGATRLLQLCQWTWAKPPSLTGTTVMTTP